MASKQQTNKNVNVLCDCCGKTISPTECSIPTDYVWHDGKIICLVCLRSGATNKTATSSKNPIASEK